MVSDSEMNAFYEGQRSKTLPLAVNDIVSVTWGEKAGLRAWMISLEAIQPEPSYLVEYDDGSDEAAPLASIKIQ